MKMQDAHEYALDFKTQHIPPWLYALYEHWMNLYQEPFKGITTDGMALFLFGNLGNYDKIMQSPRRLILKTGEKKKKKKVTFVLDSLLFKMKEFPLRKSSVQLSTC